MRKYGILKEKSRDTYKFEGGFIFKSKNNDRNLLLSKNGTNLILNNKLLKKLKRKKLMRI